MRSQKQLGKSILQGKEKMSTATVNPILSESLSLLMTTSMVHCNNSCTIPKYFKKI